MDNRPIGIFDSGVGGLTAVRRLRSLLPGEDIVFLGDTGRVPYGGRSDETILRFAREGLDFLRRKGVKAVIAACGTISSIALPVLEAPEFPLCGVLEPSVARAAQLTKNGRIGVTATAAAIRSGSYGRALQRRMPEAQVFSRACPLFVPLAESGRVRSTDRLLMQAAECYLAPLREAGVDTLILGCTHYPLLEEAVRAFMGPEVQLVDVGAEAAMAMAEQLRALDALADTGRSGRLRCFVTDDPAQFDRVGGMFVAEAGGLQAQLTPPLG